MTKEQAIKAIKEHCYFANLVPIAKEALEMAIKALEQPTSDDCVSRAEVINLFQQLKDDGGIFAQDYIENAINNNLSCLPPVTPTHGTCKDCKHWKDSDGVYRRGVGAESKCPINNSRVFEGTFYCADYEKRGSEDG